MGVTTQLIFLLTLIFPPARAEDDAAPPRSFVVESTGESVRAIDPKGKVLRYGKAGVDDAAVAQWAVDAARPGGSVTFRTGRYVFDHPVEINHSTRITGEGRQTIVVPPAKDFAFRIRRTDQSEIRRPTIHGVQWDNTLVGVVMADLTIDGGPEGRGKGIYISNVAESTLKDLWILRTRAGAGLHLDQSVMELTVFSVHFTDNGNAALEEASVVISSQTSGDANNNLRFDKTFVIFPNYIGVEIGAGTGKIGPRLIFFNQCMFHGWLPIPKVAPFDLILVRNLFSELGVIIRDSRLTNTGEKNAYLSVERGEVKMFGNVLGGGRGGHMIRGGDGARLLVSGNTFQEIKNPNGEKSFVLEASGSEISFKDNTLGKNSGQVRLLRPRSAIVSNNSFHNPGKGGRIVIEADGGPKAAVLVNGNLFFGIGENEGIEARGAVITRDNMHVNE